MRISNKFGSICFLIVKMVLESIDALPLGKNCVNFTSEGLQAEWNRLKESEARRLTSIIIPSDETDEHIDGNEATRLYSRCRWNKIIDHNPDRYPENITSVVALEQTLNNNTQCNFGQYCEYITATFLVLKKIACSENCNLFTYVKSIENIKVGMACVSRDVRPIHQKSLCPWYMVGNENIIQAKLTVNTTSILCDESRNSRCVPIRYRTGLNQNIKVGFTCENRRRG